MQTILTRSLKADLLKVFWITIAWICISMFQFFIGFSTLQQMKCVVEHGEPRYYLWGSILSGGFAGILGGSGIVFLWERWLRSLNYGRAVLYIFLSYIIIYATVAAFSGIYFYTIQENISFYSWQALSGFSTLWSRPGQLVSFIFWFLVVLGTLIQLQINDKYGPGVFRDFLLGKYFRPRREERIFMFLDLRSSTMIAEKLGEEKYFTFLNDVFKYATSSILTFKGEIYQYVGDEIVISWRMNKGMENANCVRCFLAIQKALKQKSDYFQKKYGQIPEFKAGLHYGFVMAGEIGVVKRDIAFSGDVLNTTARIQSKCNDLGVNVLLSKHLLDKLPLPHQTINPVKIGDMLLRGKEQKVILYTI